MADIDFDDYGGTLRIGADQVQRVVRVIAGVSSIALLVGGGFWGYREAVRDVSGIPFIRAAEGAMRVAPASPGGTVADHQGMAINVIAEIGGTDAMPEEIVLAPEPARLTADDTAGLAALPAAVAELALAPVSQGPMPLEAAAFAPIEVVPRADLPIAVLPVDEAGIATLSAADDAVALALAEALSDEIEIMDEVVFEAETPPEVEIAALAGSLSRSLRPQPRPETLREDGEGAEPLSAAERRLDGEIDPASLAIGTRLVQLGAYDSADQARGEWTKLAARFGDLMTGKSVVIQAAQSGGRTFYRLRAHGFAGEDDVRRFCAALVAEDAACIPATMR